MLSKKHDYIENLLAIKEDSSMGYVLAENREGLVKMLLLIRDLLGMRIPEKLNRESQSFENLSKVDQMTDILTKIRSTLSKFNQAEIQSDLHN